MRPTDPKTDPKFKPVRTLMECPKCGHNSVAAYMATDFGNEQCTLFVEHDNGARCQAKVDLMDAHRFEVYSVNKADKIGRYW